MIYRVFGRIWPSGSAKTAPLGLYVQTCVELVRIWENCAFWGELGPVWVYLEPSKLCILVLQSADSTVFWYVRPPGLILLGVISM